METYYFSSSGSDSNNGTSAGTPWQSNTKFNATTFSPGDSILFKAGETFTGPFILQNSGTSGSLITLSSYFSGGGGDKAIIDGGNLDCIKLLDNEYVTVNNFELKGSGIDTNNLGYTNSRGCGVYAHSTATTGARLKGITITNNLIHGIRTGILVGATTGFYGQTAWRGYEDTVVSSNEIYNCGVAGIYFWAEPNHPGVNWANPAPGHEHEPGETSGYPFITWDQDAARRVHRNIHVHHNNVHDNWGFKHTSYFQSRSGAGIRINNVWGGLIEHNRVDNCGNMWGSVVSTQQPANMEAEGTIDITWQYNESSNCRIGTAPYDAAGMDVCDAANHNTLVQYNYIHDNDGYGIAALGLEAGGGLSVNLTVRFNVSVNNGRVRFGHFYLVGPTDNIKIYNNLFYDDLTTGEGYPLCHINYAPNSGVIANNIFYSAGIKQVVSWLGYDPNTLYMMNNVYWHGSNPLIETTPALTYLRDNRISEKIGGTNYGYIGDFNFSNPSTTPQMLPNNPTSSLNNFNYTSTYVTPATVLETLGISIASIPTVDYHGNTFDINNLRAGPFQSNTPYTPPSILNLGTTLINGIKLGSQKVTKLYKGTTLIWNDPGIVAGASTFNFTKTLKPKMRNNEVFELQKKLVTLGYTIKNPNGYFGAQTMSAVKGFQTKHKLKADGVVGERTRGNLNML